MAGLFHRKSDTPVRLSVQQAWRELRKREHWRISGYPTSIGSEHESLNRYADVLPYDSTLVKLDSGYVHASWITDASGRRWIASQGPLSNTVEAFWRLVGLEGGPRVIVKLTGLVEAGREKCSAYVPTKQSLQAGALTVRHLSSDDTKYWTHSRLSVGETTVDHLDFKVWPDHGIPSSPEALIQLIAEMHRLNASSRPILVHCSAGVGRTGTTIALSALLDLLPDLKLPSMPADPSGMPSLSPEAAQDPVARIVDQLKDQRMLMVQTVDQLGFLYAALEQAKKVRS